MLNRRAVFGGQPGRFLEVFPEPQVLCKFAMLHPLKVDDFDQVPRKKREEEEEEEKKSSAVSVELQAEALLIVTEQWASMPLIPRKW